MQLISKSSTVAGSGSERVSLKQHQDACCPDKHDITNHPVLDHPVSIISSLNGVKNQQDFVAGL